MTQAGAQTESAERAAITLSDEQRAAVEHDAGPLIVLAGPGTGKTRVITARVAHLLQIRGVEPETVLAVTFTNKAAGELKERIGALLDPVLAARVNASTLHAFGMGVLRRFGDMLGLPSEFSMLDEAQARRLARELIRAHRLYRSSIGRGIDHAVEHGLQVAHELVSRGMPPKTAEQTADRLLADLHGDDSPEARARRAELTIFREGARLSALLDDACLERGTPRFDDLITWPMRLMQRSDLVRDIIRQRCRHVVVDEFQDLNATQIELLAVLCPPKSSPDVCVVGDDDQSIYAFRGADERAFDRFAAAWPGTRTLRLTTNYRSGEQVVTASNSIIALAGYRFDPDKRGRVGPTPPEPSSIELVRVSHDDDNGPVIAALIAAQRQADPGTDLSHIAVIARTGGELNKASVALELAGVPYISSVQASAREDPAVQTVLDWASLVADPTRTWAARAVLTRAPYGCEAASLGVLEQAYRRARALALEGEGEDPGPFIAWAVANAPPGDAAMLGSLKRGAAAEKHIGAIAATRPADDALMEIIRVTGVAHAVDLTPRDRAARVRNLVALLRFTRERLDRLDEPRDLRALLTYLEDLPDKQKSFRPAPEQTLEPEEAATGDETGAPTGAVRLLTAHAAKGLEFDTVYIPRLSGGHGYPLSRGSDDVVPEGVFPPDPHGRDERARRMDEERRVFFVALTRAKQRAVLISKVPKKPSGVSFLFDLFGAEGVALVQHEREDVAPSTDTDELDRFEAESGTAADRRAILASARRAARRQAAAALDEAERAGTVDDGLTERLRRSADWLAAVSHIARSGQVPAWARDRGVFTEAARLADRLRRGEPEPGVDFPGIKGPLKLSYSQINAYLNCPRCYLLNSVLKLPGPETAHTAVGNIVHRTLQFFMQEWSKADNEGLPTPGPDRLEALAREVFRKEWPRTLEHNPDELQRVLAQMQLYWESLHDPRTQPINFEHQFEFPFTVDAVTHRVCGKIDRIDENPATSAHRVIDYKTGYPKEDYRTPKKDDLQLGIYAMALDTIFPDQPPGSTGEYWLLASGERGTIPLADLKMDKIREQMEKAVRGIAAGEWEQGKHCDGSCTFLDDAPPLT
jgi:DNA helicase-2/ATP-dependent DNA helicase PcrA